MTDFLTLQRIIYLAFSFLAKYTLRETLRNNQLRRIERRHYARVSFDTLLFYLDPSPIQRLLFYFDGVFGGLIGGPLFFVLKKS